MLIRSLILFSLFFLLNGHSSSFASDTEDEILNEHAFGSLRRSCSNILNSILPVRLNGFLPEQKQLILDNLLDKSDLKNAARLRAGQKANQLLYKLPVINGHFYRGLQISPDQLQRILKNGIFYLDWRRPTEGLYVTNNFSTAYDHAILPDHGGYSSRFLGVILTIQPQEPWLSTQKTRVRDIRPEWITKVQIVNRQFLLGTDEKLFYDLEIKEP